ncbi:MAG: type II toxin-antitoxin system ParD family antitoxin [Alphaproteobacteria bacterium]
MSDTMNLNVRISGVLRDHVSRELADGAYENVSEYVRTLIRRDKEAAEGAAFESIKAELQLAFSAPDEDYKPLTAQDVLARNADRPQK